MKTHKLLLTFLALLLWAVQPVADEDDHDELIIRARPEAISGIASRHGLTVLRAFDQAGQNLFLMRCPLDDDDDEDEYECDDDLIEDIEADPAVENADRNDDVDLPETPGRNLGATTGAVAGTVHDDTVVWYFGSNAWTQYVRQPAAHRIRVAETHARFGGGVGIVAVIDTGADFDHPILRPALVPGFDFIANTVSSTSELADLDPATRTLLDQSRTAILEQDAVLLLNQSRTAILEQGAATRLNPSLLPGNFGHGTMVAGLVRLVAPTAMIMPLRAFRADGTSNMFDILRAIYYASDQGVGVINMSFSVPQAHEELQRAISYATARGVVAVASAGNTGNQVVVYPAGFPNVIGVASTTSQDTRSSFSNHGPALVTLAAPGEALITTFPGGNYAGVWGTSFSAALVSGGVALLEQVDPLVNQSRATEALSQARRLTPELGAGRLDLYCALSSLIGQCP